jgi:hypothetical protein
VVASLLNVPNRIGHGFTGRLHAPATVDLLKKENFMGTILDRNEISCIFLQRPLHMYGSITATLLVIQLESYQHPQRF